MHVNNKGAQMAIEILRERLKENPAEPYKQIPFIQAAPQE